MEDKRAYSSFNMVKKSCQVATKKIINCVTLNTAVIGYKLYDISLEIAIVREE